MSRGERYLISIKVICVGKLKERFFTDAETEYVKRLSGYCKLKIVEVPEHRMPDPPSNAQIVVALEKESALIRAQIPSDTKTVALCIEGRAIDSPGLSKLLVDNAVQGSSRLCFIIGGSFGLHDDMKKEADINLSMSAMTFPHNLARIMLLEQLYRAFKIAEGGKYHK